MFLKGLVSVDLERVRSTILGLLPCHSVFGIDFRLEKG